MTFPDCHDGYLYSNSSALQHNRLVLLVLLSNLYSVYVIWVQCSVELGGPAFGQRSGYSNKILLLHCSHIPRRPCLYRCNPEAYLRCRSLAEILRRSKCFMQEQRHLFGSVFLSVGTQSTNAHLLAVWIFLAFSRTRALRLATPTTLSLLSCSPILLPSLCFPPSNMC